MTLLRPLRMLPASYSFAFSRVSHSSRRHCRKSNPHPQLFAQSAANGALPQLRAAVDPETENNDYYAPSFLQMWIGASKVSVVIEEEVV